MQIALNNSFSSLKMFAVEGLQNSMKPGSFFVVVVGPLGYMCKGTASCFPVLGRNEDSPTSDCRGTCSSVLMSNELGGLEVSTCIQCHLLCCAEALWVSY